MSISVQCWQCGKNLLAPTAAAGKVLSCPSCKASLKVPVADKPGPAASDDDPPSREVLEALLPAKAVRRKAPATTDSSEIEVESDSGKAPFPARRKTYGLAVLSVLVAVGVLAILFSVFGLGGSTPSIRLGAEPPIKLTANEVIGRYLKDDLAADRDLTGRLVEITGKRSGADMIETPLPAEPAGGVMGLGEFQRHIIAQTVRAQSAPVMGVRFSLKPGAKPSSGSGVVTIRGRCKGRDGERHLILEQCDWVVP